MTNPKKEIEIDGELYVLKDSVLEVEKQRVKRFSNEGKVIRTIAMTLSEAVEPVNEEYAVSKEEFSVIDPANVLMITGKTEEAKRVLSRFKDFDDEDKPQPNISYNNVKGEATSKFSMEYVNEIMRIFNSYKSESVKISIGHDYPMTMEDKHFKFILAPRITEDEESD